MNLIASPILRGKNILLLVSGGIAVFRVAELARLLIKQGAKVRCVMTKSAEAFVTPLTFETLTGEAVHTELFDLIQDSHGIGHIALARWADAIVVAPATANVIARYAHGIADDLCTTLLLANDAPVLLAPAMNGVMWQSSAVVRNLEILRGQGVSMVGPEVGDLACGEHGAGRLSEPATIAVALELVVSAKPLQGQRWVVNTGATKESWDATRVLSNRASGLLGMWLARLAAALGATVDLIHACEISLPLPATVRTHAVESAEDMLQVSVKVAAAADIFVAAAAVSDYAFEQPVSGKLKRGALSNMRVGLRENCDIVATVASMVLRPKFVVAFAAESEKHLEHGLGKLKSKGVDALVANDVSNMASADAAAWWLCGEVIESLPRMSKADLALVLVQLMMQAMAKENHHCQ
ncbi:MAG: bifunctional phosphopantothenoylcysteine decarboxylase/phosphopantothenate--cysteine ligase CoaBC [Zetaproteobacteria bacterium]|nr:bifunctional phosphopantothenoylcysteine decarboxylase/phosphopantothenate--cysteine ligase CoaBC [Zetaproteobacteria bacterium]